MKVETQKLWSVPKISDFNEEQQEHNLNQAFNYVD